MRYKIQAHGSWPTKTSFMGSSNSIGFMLLSGQGFYVQGHCDLDFWHTGPKINRYYDWVIVNYHTNWCVALSLIGFKLLSRQGFLFKITVTLTFDLLIPKSIGIIYGSRSTKTHIMVSLSLIGFKLFSGQWFYVGCDLNLWPNYP